MNPSTMPELPCPNCQANILTEGFHNTCSETTSLREDNTATLHGDQLYIDHDESGHETVDHECDTDAYCTACDELLPWPLYELRSVEGSVAEAPARIVELLKELEKTDEPNSPLFPNCQGGAEIASSAQETTGQG